MIYIAAQGRLSPTTQSFAALVWGGCQPRSGGISVAQRVSAGNRDLIRTEPRSGGTSLEQANLGVAAPRLTPKRSAFSQRLRAGLTKCRRSAASPSRLVLCRYEAMNL